MTPSPRPNRLAHEKSPYLLQHSHNPVDWFPWGEEAFETAREQDKPIFLSIGYATCHWCHVMERESFENPQVAEQLNENFVSVKVDREELPEVDGLYMEFAQAMMSGAAGWPLNLILTPDLKPFFVATYLPPQNEMGMSGLCEVLEQIQEMWCGEDRERLVEQALAVTELFGEAHDFVGPDLSSTTEVRNTVELLFKMADPVYGGLKGGPKFPIGYQINLLLQHAWRSREARSMFFVEKTLDMMQRGGIYDHVGGGFSRYSVDEAWLIPHFEKMLYDNAILAYSYLEAWKCTGKNFYREITEQTLNYLLRDMRDEGGGFHSAEDADSEGQEGRFYTWTPDELCETLGDLEGTLFGDFYGVTEVGNFEGRSVLNIMQREEEFGAIRDWHPEDLADRLEKLRAQLLAAREKRVRPFRDDKVLAGWNGLVIHSLAEAGMAFQEERYLKAAEEAAKFIRDKLWTDGGLLRRWREEEARFPAGLDDYAYLIRGLISLFEADRGSEYLEWAIALADILEKDFKVPNGAFYFSPSNDPYLLFRRCEFYDGAEPSGNAVHSQNLLRLSQITGRMEYRMQVEDVFRATKRHLQAYPPGCAFHVMALQHYFDTEAPSLVISLNEDEENLEQLHQMIGRKYQPHWTIVWRRPSDACLESAVDSVQNLEPQDGKTTLYLCRHGRCGEPINDLSKIIESIEAL